jgi:ParB-like chromosome segregation protein Spo0J
MNQPTDAPLRTAPLNTLLGFDLATYQIPLEQLLPSIKIPDGLMVTRKYKQIVSSITEIGLIEPLSVIQPDATKPEFLLLDGHVRALALKNLGFNEAPCLFAKDDETYTYNHRINRLSTIQQHVMIRRAIESGVSKERLARAFNVNLTSINRRINLLAGIGQPDAHTDSPPAPSRDGTAVGVGSVHVVVAWHVERPGVAH